MPTSDTSANANVDVDVDTVASASANVNVDVDVPVSDVGGGCRRMVVVCVPLSTCDKPPQFEIAGYSRTSLTCLVSMLGG